MLRLVNSWGHPENTNMANRTLMLSIMNAFVVLRIQDKNGASCPTCSSVALPTKLYDSVMEGKREDTHFPWTLRYIERLERSKSGGHRHIWTLGLSARRTPEETFNRMLYGHLVAVTQHVWRWEKAFWSKNNDKPPFPTPNPIRWLPFDTFCDNLPNDFTRRNLGHSSSSPLRNTWCMNTLHEIISPAKLLITLNIRFI